MAGEIGKIQIGFYKGSTTTLEARVIMLIDGAEVRRRWRSPHPSRLATERWAREKARAHMAKASSSQSKVVPTFGEFAGTFIEAHIEGNALRPSTADALRNQVRSHLIPLFGSTRLDAFTDADVLKLKACKNKETSERLADSTINGLLQTFGMILRAAVGAKHTDRVPKWKRIKESELPHNFYPPEEYERLVLAASSSPKILALVLLAGDAGLRRGEIIALDWRRIDLVNGKVHVQCADWRGIIGPPKGKKARVVRMTKRLRDALAALPREGERVLTRDDMERSDCPFVPGQPSTGSSLRHWLWIAEDAAGLPRMGLHSLRHTFCSHLAMAGTPVTAIRDMAGHSSIKITNRYMHLAPGGLDAAVESLERLHASARGSQQGKKATRSRPPAPPPAPALAKSTRAKPAKPGPAKPAKRSRAHTPTHG